MVDVAPVPVPSRIQSMDSSANNAEVKKMLMRRVLNDLVIVYFFL